VQDYAICNNHSNKNDVDVVRDGTGRDSCLGAAVTWEQMGVGWRVLAKDMWEQIL